MKKNDPLVLPGERLDDLIIGGLKIIQHPQEFCFTLDAVLLAQFATVKAQTSAVDLGTGTGAVALLLAARGATVTGVELTQQVAAMFERSIRLNKLEQTVRSVCYDIRKIAEIMPAGQASLVVANPPYRPVGQGRINPQLNVASARHELTLNLAEVVAAAGYLLKYRGRFAMVHLPERLTDVLTTMRQAGIEPKRLRLVHPKRHKPPNILLVEGVRGANSGLDVLPPLYIYEADGEYSQEIMAYYVPNPAI